MKSNNPNDLSHHILPNSATMVGVCITVTCTIAILLALTVDLFDRVPIDQMTAAEHAVDEAAVNLPADLCARLDTEKKLSAEDRKTIIEIASKALEGF